MASIPLYLMALIITHSLAAFGIIWIRYRHVKCHYCDIPGCSVQVLNISSFVFGFLSVIGILLVASFQVILSNLLSGDVYSHIFCLRCRLSHFLFYPDLPSSVAGGCGLGGVMSHVKRSTYIYLPCFTHTHMHIHTHTHTYTYTYTHTYVHMHTHTHVHTQTLAQTHKHLGTLKCKLCADHIQTHLVCA